MQMIQRQRRYKNILKAYGLEITGKERFTKAADSIAVSASTSASACAAPGTGKRKAAEKIQGEKKAAKKARLEDADEDEVVNDED